jgi:hypothetical protein
MDLGSRVVAATVLNAKAFVMVNGLAVALHGDTRRGRQAFRVAVKLQSEPPRVHTMQLCPGGTFGPACAGEPANVTNANAEIATADTIITL